MCQQAVAGRGVMAAGSPPLSPAAACTLLTQRGCAQPPGLASSQGSGDNPSQQGDSPGTPGVYVEQGALVLLMTFLGFIKPASTPIHEPGQSRTEPPAYNRGASGGDGTSFANSTYCQRA